MNSNNSESGQALICIPDISGFTKFMVENDIEYSRKVIPPLLRTIINSNQLNMTVGEIEGDAVVFYRFGKLPTLNDLRNQCNEFYKNFSEALINLANQFGDNFTKYASANKLSLKIINHAANISSTHIEGITKLIGEDVVIVHKLLKNSITDLDYILLTEKLLSNYTEEEINQVFGNQSLIKGEDEYEHIGTITYYHVNFPAEREVKNKMEQA